jgi:hypothetical protein
MMTLSIELSGGGWNGKSAALLASCHSQISLPVAAFCGRDVPPASAAGDMLLGCGLRLYVLDLF